MAIFAMERLALKWAFKKPVTSRYPFEPRVPLPHSRGKLEMPTPTCIHCKICEKKCPTDAITVDRAKKTWVIDRLRCISCGACVENCPKDSLTLSEMHNGPVVTRDREFAAAVVIADKPSPPKV
ncbi:MAG: 4Fe-4S binding protein [Phycisphaerales bacterium]|nr:4Fe-4S binding protein [Phycisphaerales bacterium]